ncbi:MAG: SigB/SigF/SigG family RNA polymerase sigma factor [Clostridia bacterium]|nr:SigB/SigF/SigG family RNA polymerase sigma factor [Clostridia bacterium]
MLGQDETLDLIRRAQSGDELAKEKLVTENSPLIKSVIRWFKDKGIENDDLYQLGCMGFLKAINNFDCSFNVKFSTYVVPMVVGEIKRFMRDDGAVKVSRAIKGLNLKINKFVDEFFVENGRRATISDIAEHFKISEQEVVLAMDSAKMPVSLYAPFDDGEEDGLTIIDRFDGQENDDFVDKFALNDIISKLEERDKKIILMRYFYDKTQSEIAQRLGVSQVQVSRLENKILENLRKKLEEV